MTSRYNSILDHIYSNLNNNQITCKIIVSDISDHLPTLVYYNSSYTKLPKKILTKRNMKTFDSIKFLNDLTTAMKPLLQDLFPNVNNMTSVFLSTFKTK